MAKRFTALQAEEQVTPELLFTKCEQMQETSKARIYQDVIDNKDIIRRNLKLMNLDISNLAGMQIQQIEGSLEINEKSYDKLSFLRSLRKFGLANFDPSSLFLSMNILNKR